MARARRRTSCGAATVSTPPRCSARSAARWPAHSRRPPMHEVVQIMRQIARHEIMQRSAAYLGTVKSVQGGPDDHSCTVELRESRIVLPNVPIAVGFMGFAALPAEGDLVVVLFI